MFINIKNLNFLIRNLLGPDLFFPSSSIYPNIQLVEKKIESFYVDNALLRNLSTIFLIQIIK